MLNINVTLEDTQIVLNYSEATRYWEGVVCDTLTGAEKIVSFTGDEVSVILAIATHPDGEPLNEEFTAGIYPIAEAAHERNRLVGGLRIIP